MKKIVVFLLCLLSLNQTSLFAKMPSDIYVGGSGEYKAYFDTLDIPLQNTHFIGDRNETIFYLDDNDVVQTVSIASKSMDDLEEGTVFLTSKSFKENTIVNDIYRIDSVSYYIVGSTKDATGSVVSSFIQFLVHDQVVASKTYQGNHLVFLKSIVVVENRIYVLFERKLHAQHANMGLLELSEDLKEIRRKEFIGEKEETAQALYFWNNHLYIVGESSSVSGLFAGSAPFSIVVLSVFIHDFNQVQIKYIGNNGMNFLVDSVFDRGTTYVLLKLSGNDGVYKSPEWTYRNYVLLMLDPYLNETGIQYFDQNLVGQFEGILLTNDEVIAIHQRLEEEDVVISFYGFTPNLYKKERVEHVVAKDEYYLNSLSYYIEKDIFVALEMTHSTTQTKHIFILCLDTLLNKVYCEELTAQMTDIIFLKQDGVSVHFLGKEEEEIHSYKATYIKVKDIEIVNNESIFCEVSVHKSTMSFAESFLFKEPERLYGSNKVGFVLELDEIEIVFFKDVYLPSNVNVQSNQQYDIGVALDFYGEGYLNEIKIPKQFIVSEQGKYLLEVVGNLEKRSISFEVVSLSVPLHASSEKEYINLSTTFLTQPSETKEVTYTVSSQNLEEGSIVTFYISLGVCAVILSTLLRKIYEKSRK